MMTGGRTQPRLLLAALGNPLLDIIVRDEEERLVRSHNLERNVAQEVDTLATGLYDEVLAMPGVVTAGGGCSLNTARVFSWLAGAGHRDSCVFIGCVGEDERAAGERRVSAPPPSPAATCCPGLRRLLQQEHVPTCLSVEPGQPTGHCIALVQVVTSAN